MPRKQCHGAELPKSNQRGEFRTWHFTSVLTPTHEIHADINWIAHNNIDAVHPQNLLVKAQIRERVLILLNEARPACVSFISWRFSRVDALSWISNAKAKLPLPDLPFEGYIQSTAAIDLPRLHRWMPDAIWRNVSGKLHRSKAYQEFSAANDAFEYCNDGSIALSNGGRPRKSLSVSTDLTIACFVLVLAMFYAPLISHALRPALILSPLIQAIAPTYTPPPTAGTGGGP